MVITFRLKGEKKVVVCIPVDPTAMMLSFKNLTSNVKDFCKVHASHSTLRTTSRYWRHFDEIRDINLREGV